MARANGARRGMVRGLALMGAVTAVAAIIAVVAATRGRASAGPVVRCTAPPAVFPVGGITPGMLGYGKTTVRGTQPVRFGVKVLGVLPDGVAPGVPLVVVQLTGAVMQQTNGGFAGMSGSPVYLKGRLAGAVAYGLVAGDNFLAGVTPAKPMIDLFGYPSGGGAPAMHLRRAVRLPTVFRAHLAARLGQATASVPSSLRIIPTPLGMAGATQAQLDRMATLATRRGLALRPFAGGSATAPSGTPAGNPVPGAPFASVIAYGDASAYGIGITTAVCGNAAVAWGHPFNFDGATAMGFNAANVLTVAPDLSNLFGGTMIATVGATRGTVDQDRLTGLRGVVGAAPRLTPVTSTTTNADLKRTLQGAVVVAHPDWLSLVAANHFFIDTTTAFDRYGAGTQAMTWTITGTDASGDAFAVRHHDTTVSDWSIADDSVFDPAGWIAAIEFNPFERVHITSVTSRATVTQARLTAKISGLLSASSLAPTLAKRTTLPVAAGGWIKLAIQLRNADGTVTTVLQNLTAPAASAPLTVRGGQPKDMNGCIFLCPPGSGSTFGARSFAGLVSTMNRMESRDEVITMIGGRPVAGSVRLPVISGTASVQLQVR